MHVETTYARLQPSVVVALLAASVFVTAHATAQWGVGGALIATSVVLAAGSAAIDAQHGRIPDVGVVVVAVPPVVLAAGAAATGHLGAVLPGVLLGVAAFAGPMFVLHVVSPESLGFGDVKLGASLGASLGLVEPRLGLVALCVGSAISVALGLATGRRSVPFGPGLVIGAGAALGIAAGLGLEGPSTWR